MALEAAFFIPILMLLLVGMVQIAKISYTYYTLKKTLYTIARHVSTQQGGNLCDAADTAVQEAISFALTGTSDGSADSFLPALSADMIQVHAERYNIDSADFSDACDGTTAGQSPDYVVVSIPNGYQVNPRIPFILLDPILLRPQIKMPFGGTGGT